MDRLAGTPEGTVDPDKAPPARPEERPDWVVWVGRPVSSAPAAEVVELQVEVAAGKLIGPITMRLEQEEMM